MKKFFTLCIGLIAALAIQAQSDFPLQFADKDGNIIADGTSLDITEFEMDAFGEVMMSSKLYVKNITETAVQGGGIYTIKSIGSGSFQTCFPTNCVNKTAAGTYETGDGSLNAGELKNMQTEWMPSAEGTCKVTYQLITYKQNVITKKWNKDKKGPTVTINFTYGSTGIDNTTDDKKALSVEYYSLTGRQVVKPAHGMYIVTTTYADGSKKSRKQLF